MIRIDTVNYFVFVRIYFILFLLKRGFIVGVFIGVCVFFCGAIVAFVVYRRVYVFTDALFFRGFTRRRPSFFLVWRQV